MGRSPTCFFHLQFDRVLWLKILECVVSQREVYSDSIIPRVKSQHLKTITHNLVEEVQYSVHKTTALSFPLRE